MDARTTSPFAADWTLPVVEALSQPSAGVIATARSSSIDEAAAAEFDAFSAERLSRQFILVYKEGMLASHTQTNVTWAILKTHQPYLQHVMAFSTLPGCLITVNMAALDDSGLLRSRTREEFLTDVVDSIRAHEAVAFVSPNQPLQLDAVTSQAVEAGAYVSTGVRRILAATRSTVNRAANVAVAVLDTGVDLTNENLNVQSGINCIQLLSRAMRSQTEAHDFSLTADDFGNVDPARFSREKLNSADSIGSTSLDDFPAQDDNNHGSHVAGIIGSRNQPNGIIGVAPGTLLYAVKILDAFGRGSFAHMVCGLDWLANNAQRLNIKVRQRGQLGTTNERCQMTKLDRVFLF